MRIFAESELSDYLRQKRLSFAAEVSSADKEFILKVNETEYTEYLANRYSIIPLELHFDKVTVSDYEAMIQPNSHSSRYFSHDNTLCKAQVFKYHLPYSGDVGLIRCRPSTRICWSIDVNIDNAESCVCFDIINHSQDIAEAKRESETTLGNIRQQLDYVLTDLASYNADISAEVQNCFLSRKQEILKQSELLASLGVPIKKKDGISETFSVPVHKKKAVAIPSVKQEKYEPEPSMDDSIYQDILNILSDVGVEMERHPSIYQDKGEEALRDYLLMTLAPHFDNATGETFNKGGKTDILIRHEGSNLFVAECKIWKGAKVFHKAIDQLLGYLTWRDSKSAIICFVENKELNPVLETIKAVAPEHSCFIKAHGEKKQGWYNYEFHLLDDESRGVNVAVLCFHFPKD